MEQGYATPSPSPPGRTLAERLEGQIDRLNLIAEEFEKKAVVYLSPSEDTTDANVEKAPQSGYEAALNRLGHAIDRVNNLMARFQP